MLYETSGQILSIKINSTIIKMTTTTTTKIFGESTSTSNERGKHLNRRLNRHCTYHGTRIDFHSDLRPDKNTLRVRSRKEIKADRLYKLLSKKATSL